MIPDDPQPSPRVAEAFAAFLRRLRLPVEEEGELRHHVTAWACSYANAARRGTLLVLADQVAGEPTIRDAVDLLRRAALAVGEEG